MNKKFKIFICSLIIFFLFSGSLFTYYNVKESKKVLTKFIEKSIKWEDYIAIKPLDKIRIYNFSTKNYDEYLLDDVNYNEVISITKDIVKEVNQRSNIRFDSRNIPAKLEYGSNDYLFLSNVVSVPIYSKGIQWYDQLETENRTYTDLPSADLYNIPKDITHNSQTWSLLTDMVKFENSGDKYNCIATYSKVNRVEEERSTVEEFETKAIYSGKIITKTGNVKLKYRHTSLSKSRELFKQFSDKFLFISIITVITIVLILKIFMEIRKTRS